MRKARIVFEVIWWLSIVMVFTFHILHMDSLRDLAIGSMWTSLIVKSSLAVLTMIKESK